MIYCGRTGVRSWLDLPYEGHESVPLVVDDLAQKFVACAWLRHPGHENRHPLCVARPLNVALQSAGIRGVLLRRQVR